MSRQFWSELIWWATADATAVASTAAETIIVPDVTIPANYMADGRVLRVTLAGKMSNTASATIQWATRWGGVAGTLLAQSAAMGIGTAVTNIIYRIEMEIQTRANGATGALMVFSEMCISLTGSTSIDQVYSVAGASAPAQVTSDLTADKLFSNTGKWSVSSASNTLTNMQYFGESLN